MEAGLRLPQIATRPMRPDDRAAVRA
eukprot:COSAG04_NODE_7418_length_1131_cov_6.780039_2_plen_25_part_01